MSQEDVFYIRKMMRRMWVILITILPLFLLSIGAFLKMTITDHYDLPHKADKEYVDQNYVAMQILLTKYQATWDAFMVSETKNTARLEKELDTIKKALNEHFINSIGPMRSTSKKEAPFTFPKDSSP